MGGWVADSWRIHGGWMDTNKYIACLRQVVAFAPKVIKCAAYGVAKGRGWRYGFKVVITF